jgi:hypothetical protein
MFFVIFTELICIYLTTKPLKCYSFSEPCSCLKLHQELYSNMACLKDNTIYAQVKMEMKEVWLSEKHPYSCSAVNMVTVMYFQVKGTLLKQARRHTNFVQLYAACIVYFKCIF